jgi:hypothetical protein
VIASTISLSCGHWPLARTPLLLVVFLFSLYALRISYKRLLDKSLAREDWKTAAQLATKNATNRNLYFTTSAVDDKWREMITNFYLQKVSKGSLGACAFVPGEMEIKRPALVLSGNDTHFDYVLEDEMRKLHAQRIFPLLDENEGDAAAVWLID